MTYDERAKKLQEKLETEIPLLTWRVLDSADVEDADRVPDWFIVEMWARINGEMLWQQLDLSEEIIDDHAAIMSLVKGWLLEEIVEEVLLWRPGEDKAFFPHVTHTLPYLTR